MNSKIIMEDYFSGDSQEWLNQIPESVIDEAVKILNIDPNQSKAPSGYSPVNYNLDWHYSAKVCLWGDLVRVIHRWGKPSPSKMQTAPADLKKYSERINKSLSDALETLRSLEYGRLFEYGTMTKEFKIANRMRQQSEVMRAKRDGGRCSFVSALIVKQDFETNGFWGKYCPFDHELESAINSLEKIADYADKVFEDAKKDVPPPGEKKKGKENYDNLVWAICHIFKEYTGDVPLSSAREDGSATGKIIPFLKLVLEQSAYSYETTEWALEKKIRELKGHPQHGKLWQDGKN